MTGWVILVDQPKDLPNAEIKETDRGFIVMEVNDNPNLEHGIEDQVGKDDLDAAAQVVRRAVRTVAARGEWSLHD